MPLDASWDLDATSMARAIEMMQPSVVFVASPNNPTGNRMSDARLEAVLAAAKGAFVVLDEAYVDYAHTGSLRAWRASAERERVSFHARIEKLDLEHAIRNGVPVAG